MSYLSRPVLAGCAMLATVSLAACGGSPQAEAGGGATAVPTTARGQRQRTRDRRDGGCKDAVG